MGNPEADLQPTLSGKLVSLRPLKKSDFESLYEVASDPLIWELHPEKNRYQRAVFEKFFASAIESKGALTILDSITGSVLGSSRFTGYDRQKEQLEIGYTFLSRSCWGKGHNTELKRLMLDHAFSFVKSVLFYIGESNFRSRKAVEKLGATFVEKQERKPFEGDPYFAVVYRLDKN